MHIFYANVMKLLTVMYFTLSVVVQDTLLVLVMNTFQSEMASNILSIL